MSPKPPKAHIPSPCFPRVSGDEPVFEPSPAALWEFSPRERG